MSATTIQSWVLRSCGLMLILAAMYLIITYYHWRVGEKIAHLPVAPRCIIKQHSHSDGEYFIPKVIWAYWDNPVTMPVLVRANVDRWQKMLSPEYEVRFLSETTVSRYLSSSRPAQFSQLLAQHRADWIRVELLARYGGIWTDSSILFNSKAALDDLYNNATILKSEFTGFYITSLQTLPEFPVVENWFFMVPRGSLVIELWRQEFTKAIEMGFGNYCRHVQNDLGVDVQNILKHHGLYLTQHVCMQTVLQHYRRDASLYLTDAEDTMYRIHHVMRWNFLNIRRAILQPWSLKVPFIKLRCSERTFINVDAWKKVYQSED